MAIDAIGALSDTTSTEIPRNAGLSQEDFMRILLAQLQFQDPLKPMDNQQFIAQLAQFSGLEINRQQSEKIDTLLSMESTNQAAALVGKSIELKTSTGSTAGKVTAVSFSTGQPRLTIDSNGSTFVDVKLSDVVLIR